MSKDDTRKVQGRDPEEPIDYSPSSGPIGASERGIEQFQSHPFPWTSNHTNIGTDDVADGRVSMSKEYTDEYGTVTYDDLQHANRSSGNNSSRTDNRERARYNDFVTIVDTLSGVSPQKQDWLRERSMSLYQYFKDNREDGFQFGGEWPIEVSELAIVTIAARQLIDIKTFDERDMDNGIHNMAFDGDQLAHLCDVLIPVDKDIDTDTIKDCRVKLTNTTES